MHVSMNLYHGTVPPQQITLRASGVRGSCAPFRFDGQPRCTVRTVADWIRPTACSGRHRISGMYLLVSVSATDAATALARTRM
jgi:hypothetical protein